MKAICNGQTTKAEVVHETIEQYRDVYARMLRHPEVLRTVSTDCERTLFLADLIVGCSEVCFR